MHVDPRQGFRGRVLSRLHREPARSSLVPRLVMVGAALALVLIALVVAPGRQSRVPAEVARSSAAPAQAVPSGRPPSAAAASGATAPVPSKPPLRRKREFTSEPIAIPPVGNLFANRADTARAASVEGEAIWAAPPPQPQENPDSGLAPLAVPSVAPPAPIVIPPIGPRGPGQNE